MGAQSWSANVNYGDGTIVTLTASHHSRGFRCRMHTMTTAFTRFPSIWPMMTARGSVAPLALPSRMLLPVVPFLPQLRFLKVEARPYSLPISSIHRMSTRHRFTSISLPMLVPATTRRMPPASIPTDTRYRLPKAAPTWFMVERSIKMGVPSTFKRWLP